MVPSLSLSMWLLAAARARISRLRVSGQGLPVNGQGSLWSNYE
nr:MAG TPA: hypothetical protein [Caudoviricetes sp.]